MLISAIPQFAPSASKELSQLIRKGDRRTLRQLITDVPLVEDVNSTHPLKKPDYLFGDSVEDPIIIPLKAEQWLHKDEAGFLYIPHIPRHRPLIELRQQAVKQEMSWDLTEECERVHCGYITHHSSPSSSNRNRITGLHPGVSGLNDPPRGELFTVANTLKNRLARLGREMPANNHRCYGWVHSSDKFWWSRLTNYVLARWGEELKASGLYGAVRATMYGLTPSVPHFLALMELYNPDTNTFLTKRGELGLALHEMHKVSDLPMGNMIYQEYFPSNRELRQLKSATPDRYDTLWDLTCHYYTALAGVDPVLKRTKPQISLKRFANYLFRNLESNSGKAICELRPLTTTEINELIKKSDAHSYTTAGIEDDFSAGTKFRTFLWHTMKPIHPMTLLAGYLTIWLKKCVVPYHPTDILPVEVLYPAVQLAHRKSLSLLPAMIADIHRGLRQLVSTFTQEGSKPSAVIQTAKVDLPYTYLIAWFALHRPDMIDAPKVANQSVPLLQLIEDCKWKGRGFSDIRKRLQEHKCWVFSTCFPRFSGRYGDSLVDMEKPGTGQTCLDAGCFDWLVNIRPGYVVFRVKNYCYIEPYLPCRFAQQLGYDQIYVGNPSSGLRTRGGLVDGARAWLWNVTGCTGARFNLPVAERQLELTFLYCRWLLAANESVAVKPIAELTAEAAARIATQMVYEAEYQKRKGKEPVGPSTDKEQEDDPFFFEEECSDADVVSGKAKATDPDEEEPDTGLSESFFAELLDLAVADQIRRLKTRKRWKALPTYPHKMFVEIPGLGFEGGKEVKGRRLSRTNSRTVARIDPSIEPYAESIPSKPTDPDEVQPCKRQKMTLRRRITSSVPNAEPLSDMPIVGGGNVLTLVIFPNFSSTKL